MSNQNHFDVIIIGTGAGGGTQARSEGGTGAAGPERTHAATGRLRFLGATVGR